MLWKYNPESEYPQNCEEHVLHSKKLAEKIRRRKMKCWKSSETRFGKVSWRLEPFLTGKKPFKITESKRRTRSVHGIELICGNLSSSRWDSEILGSQDFRDAIGEVPLPYLPTELCPGIAEPGTRTLRVVYYHPGQN